MTDIKISFKSFVAANGKRYVRWTIHDGQNRVTGSCKTLPKAERRVKKILQSLQSKNLL